MWNCWKRYTEPADFHGLCKHFSTVKYGSNQCKMFFQLAVLRRVTQCDKEMLVVCSTETVKAKEQNDTQVQACGVMVPFSYKWFSISVKNATSQISLCTEIAYLQHNYHLHCFTQTHISWIIRQRLDNPGRNPLHSLSPVQTRSPCYHFSVNTPTITTLLET